MNSEKEKKISLKIKELLSFFQKKKAGYQVYLMPFLNKKASLLDKKRLRKNLICQIKSHRNYVEKGYNWGKLLQLRTKPSCPWVGLSISYCDYLGAYVIVFDKKLSIGFDMEQKKRVTNQVAQRISSNREFDQSPHPALLWVAKEAGVKSLSAPSSPILFKDCLLSNWRVACSNQNYFFDFCLRGGHKYKGVAGVVGDLAIAYTEV
ncbi:MAG: hypothetical protein OXN83_04690 [Oligoflexia bacterium]|nr:hypothetical protein [Oligoflexia bacterium]